MMVSRSRFIADTNVLIDLYHGNVLNAFFTLPYQFISPDVIIEELDEPGGKELTHLGLQSGELSGEQLLQVEFLSQHHPNIAVNDLFALVLAADTQLPLLTGDRRLRDLASRHNVRVYGVLWVLDEMVQKGVLKPTQAGIALQAMLQSGSRLPLAECQQRFRLWKEK